MRVIKSFFSWLLLLVVIVWVSTWCKKNEDAQRVSVGELSSFDQCGLPGLHGATNLSNGGCEVYALKGAWIADKPDALGTSCSLTTYNINGTLEVFEYIRTKGIFSSDTQSEIICKGVVGAAKLEAIKAHIKGLQPPVSDALQKASATIRNTPSSVEFDVSSVRVKDDMEALQSELATAAYSHVSFYREDAPTVVVVIFNAKVIRVIPNRLLCRGIILNEKMIWACDPQWQKFYQASHLDMLRMSPDRRRKLYATLQAYLYLKATRYSKGTGVANDEAVALMTAGPALLGGLPKDVIQKILKDEAISADQLDYAAHEGAMLGWYEAAFPSEYRQAL